MHHLRIGKRFGIFFLPCRGDSIFVHLRRFASGDDTTFYFVAEAQTLRDGRRLHEAFGDNGDKVLVHPVNPRQMSPGQE